MFVWLIAGLLGIFAGLLLPFSWFVFEQVQYLLSTAMASTAVAVFLLPVAAALVIYLLLLGTNAFRTADSFTYFYSELHYNEGRRNFLSSMVHGFASFLLLLGGGIIGLEALIYEWMSAAGSLLGDRLRLPGMQLRAITASGLAAALAAMLAMPTPAIFFVIEILSGWTGSVSIIGPIALASILAAGVSSSITGPTGYFHLIGGTDGGLAIALRGAGLELGSWQIFGASLLVSVLASLLSVFTIWLYQRTDFIWHQFFAKSENEKRKKKYHWESLFRLLGWAIMTLIVLRSFSDATGTGIKLVQNSMWESATLSTALMAILLRLFLGALSYCALGSMGLILPALALGALAGAYLANITQAFFAISAIHMAQLMMGAYFAGLFGTPIAATALVFQFAGGTSAEHLAFLIAVAGANFLTHFLTGFVQKDRLATQGLYRHEIRFRNGMCFNTLSSITVKDAMLSWVVPIAKSASVGSAYSMLMDSRFLKLPVVDENKALQGMLSLADFYNLEAWKNLGENTQVHELLGIEDVMRPITVQVHTNMSLEEALAIMGNEDIVPVVDIKQNIFAGILLRSDVINIYNKEVLKRASGSRGRLYG